MPCMAAAVQDGVAGALPVYYGTRDALVRIWQEEGWRALYAGIAPALLGAGKALSVPHLSCRQIIPMHACMRCRARHACEAKHIMRLQGSPGASTSQPTMRPSSAGSACAARIRCLRRCTCCRPLRPAAWCALAPPRIRTASCLIQAGSCGTAIVAWRLLGAHMPP
jgi:hypothetical protein